MTSADQVNQILREHSRALSDALSPVGRAAFYPPDIPFQAQQARGKRYNATIGQITDGGGRVLSLPALEAGLSGLDAEERNRALLYSPIGGLPSLRERWREHERPQDAAPSSLPLVTVGLTHGLALIADLFGGPDRKVLVPAPFWGNYRQVFGLRTGAEVVPVDAYRDRRYQPRALADRLDEIAAGEPVVVILNLPSNPGGYMPSAEEREILVEGLIVAADQRPLVVVCDDAYSGLVFEPGVPDASIFWDLCDRHPSLVPIRLSAATKEMVFFGGRVGFLSHGHDPASPVGEALENKLLGLLRAGVGSPVALSQVVLLRALESGSIEAERRETKELLAERYRALRRALDEIAEPSAAVSPLPFNAGAFALLELAPGLDPEAIRRRLLEEEDTGVIAIPPRYLRIAFCSVAAPDLAEVVRRVVATAEAMLLRHREAAP